MYTPLFHKLLQILLLSICCAASAEQPVADSATNKLSLRQQFLQDEAGDIAKETAQLAVRRTNFEKDTDDLVSRSVDQEEVEQASLDVETLKLALKSVKLDVDAAQSRERDLSSQVQELEDELQNLATEADAEGQSQGGAEVEAKLAEGRALLLLQAEHIEQLERRNQLAKDRLDLSEKWLLALQEAFHDQRQQAGDQSIEELAEKLVVERKQQQDKAAGLRSEIIKLRRISPIPLIELDLAETQLLDAEDSIFLLEVQFKAAKAWNRLASFSDSVVGQSADSRSLKFAVVELDTMSGKIQSFAQLFDSKLELLEQRQIVIDKRAKSNPGSKKTYQQAQKILNNLIDHFSKQKDEINRLHQATLNSAEAVAIAYQAHKDNILSERHHWPVGGGEWQPLLQELQQLPRRSWQLLRNTWVSIWGALDYLEVDKGAILVLLSLLWSAVCLSLGRLKTSVIPGEAASFTRKIAFIIYGLLKGNRFGLLIGGVLIMLVWILDMTPTTILLINGLVGIWLISKMLVGSSHWVFGSALGLSQPQPNLHRLITVCVLLAALLNLGLLLDHIQFISVPLGDLLERIFLVLLLPLAYLAFRVRTLLMEYIKGREDRGYWSGLAGLAALVIPLSILVAASLGAAGYISLAWMVAVSLLGIITVVLAWLVIRGLVIDLAKTMETRTLQESGQGDYWVKVLINPVQYLLRVGLLATMIWMLYQLLAGEKQPLLHQWLTYPVFSIGNTSISSLNLLLSLMVLAMLIYMGRWARTLTYGWIFRNIQDHGVRNSLSVFVQYLVIMLGFFLVLNILGLNLTSLAVFAGALGVGLGFGLQNIANNFISGLILLAERPVQTKDWVTIGGNEGKVTEIGMRSVTITTWDNQDVIIPNADLISNAFVNWTHSSSLLRTVLYIGVGYQDDPHQALQVIQEAVTMQPEVALAPAPKVWLNEFSASSVDFRVNYYVDVNQFSRLEVKSKILFAIWDALKEAQISIPFPQQDVYIKELPQTMIPG